MGDDPFEFGAGFDFPGGKLSNSRVSADINFETRLGNVNGSLYAGSDEVGIAVSGGTKLLDANGSVSIGPDKIGVSAGAAIGPKIDTKYLDLTMKAHTSSKMDIIGSGGGNFKINSSIVIRTELAADADLGKERNFEFELSEDALDFNIEVDLNFYTGEYSVNGHLSGYVPGIFSFRELSANC